MAYKKRWFDLETFLGFRDRPLLNPIEDTLPSKVKLEQIERDFAKTNEKIDQLHLDEIKDWIESPLTSQMRIGLFL